MRALLKALSQAHAMPPHLGAGAGQCIEDAYLLAELLTHSETNHDNVEVGVMTHSLKLMMH